MVTDGLHSVSSPALAVVLPSATLEPVILGLEGPIVVDPDRVEVRGQVVGATEAVNLVWRLDGAEIDRGPRAWLGQLAPGRHTISLGATAEGRRAGKATRSFTVELDRDHDGTGDSWEKAHGLDPKVADSATDTDHDSLTALAEQVAGSDPRRLDTDGDRYADAVEVAGGSDPADPRSTPVRLHGDPTRAVPRLGATSDGSGGTPIGVLLGAVVLVGVGGTVLIRRRHGSVASDG